MAYSASAHPWPIQHPMALETCLAQCRNAEAADTGMENLGLSGCACSDGAQRRGIRWFPSEVSEGEQSQVAVILEEEAAVELATLLDLRYWDP